MSFFDSLFDVDDARRDIEQGTDEARGYLSQGLQDFTNTTQTGLDQSVSYLQPQIDQGNEGLRLFSAAIGALGPDAQASFFGDFQNDPGYNASLNAGLNAVDRSAAARGNLFSGRQKQDLFSFGQRFQNDAFNNRIQQLYSLAGLGNNASSNASSLTSNAYKSIADAQFGTAQQNANLGLGQAQALADSRGAGFNKALGALNSFASAASKFMPKPGAGGVPA